MELRYPPEAAVLVAGIPGAGKSTLIARARFPAETTVLDTDPRREALGRARWRCPTGSGARCCISPTCWAAWRALGRPGAVVIGEPGTRRVLRRALLAPRAPPRAHRGA